MSHVTGRGLLEPRWEGQRDPRWANEKEDASEMAVATRVVQVQRMPVLLISVPPEGGSAVVLNARAGRMATL